MKITKYGSIDNPKVDEVIDIDSFITTIKDGDENKKLIESARAYGKGHEKYTKIKESLLPSFRFNFMFDNYASNDNITSPTGLIYLDVDNNTNSIPDSDYIFAKWKSLSNNGYGILVKVDNLTLDNFKYVYDSIGSLLGIIPDPNARKATQQTVLSYDENIFHNPNSLVYHYVESKKVSSHNIKEKGECMGTDDTFLDNSSPIRFNNIDDYFKDNPDKPYIVFEDEKVMICDPFVPFRVEKGKRNSTMYYCLSQYAMLNTNVGSKFLMSCATTFNRNMSPRLNESELESIVKSILKKKKEGTLEIYYNKERRILFNPSIKMPHAEKMKIVNKELAEIKNNKTRIQIYEIIEDWDFGGEGKITQDKVSKVTGLSLSTIKRHWKHFKTFVTELNEEYKAKAIKPKLEGLYPFYNKKTKSYAWVLFPSRKPVGEKPKSDNNSDVVFLCA
jgi:hypothetical protein